MELKKLKSALLVGLLVIVLLLISGTGASAVTFRRGETVTISSETVLNDDVYMAGGTVTVDGVVGGDVVAAAGLLTVNGQIEGDVIAAGGTVILDGTVSDSVRVAGGEVSISGQVRQDLVVFGGNVIMSKDSIVQRDLVGGAGNIRIAGKIGRDVRMAGGAVTISADVGDDALVEADELIVASGATIDGDLRYKSPKKATVERGATIGGEVKHTIPEKRVPVKRSPAAIFLVLLLTKLWSFVALGIVGLILSWLMPQKLISGGEKLSQSPWKSLGLGFALLVNVPIAIIIAMITIVGIPLAMITAAVYGIAIYGANIYVGFYIGDRILNRAKREKRPWPGYSVLLGLLILAVVRLVPILGFFVSLAVILFGLGAMVIASYEIYKKARETSLV